MTETDDLVKEFLVESYENLDQLDRDLILLEEREGDRELLASIFFPHTPLHDGGVLLRLCQARVGGARRRESAE